MIASMPSVSPEALPPIPPAEHRRRARLHARRRAAERYGLRFEAFDVLEHEEMIRRGLARRIGGGGLVGFYEIEGEFRPYYAVFSGALECIVTYLRAAHDWPGRRVRSA